MKELTDEELEIVADKIVEKLTQAMINKFTEFLVKIEAAYEEDQA